MKVVFNSKSEKDKIMLHNESEKDKMLKGEWYNANFDKELIDERTYVKDLCFQLNQTRPSDSLSRRRILRKILQTVDFDTVEILSPLS